MKKKIIETILQISRLLLIELVWSQPITSMRMEKQLYLLLVQDNLRNVLNFGNCFVICVDRFENF